MIEDKKRNKYMETDEIIKEAYNEYAWKHNLRPTQQEIADICGMSRKTVWIHLQGNPFFMGPERKNAIKKRVEEAGGVKDDQNARIVALEADIAHIKRQYAELKKNFDEKKIDAQLKKLEGMRDIEQAKYDALEKEFGKWNAEETKIRKDVL